MKLRVRWRWTLSLVALVGVNAAPLLGVFLFDWDAGVIVLLYWAENLVIGAFTILRMVLAPVPVRLFHLGKLFAIPFFALHFGAFCAVHGLFLMAFFQLGGGPDVVLAETASSGIFVFFELLVSVLRSLWRNPPPAFGWLVIGLIVSHGISFVQNFLFGGEREVLTIGKLMSQPYKRIVILHVAILAGGVPVLLLGSPDAPLTILVILKIVLDVSLHVREHRRLGPSVDTRERTDGADAASRGR